MCRVYGRPTAGIASKAEVVDPQKKEALRPLFYLLLLICIEYAGEPLNNLIELTIFQISSGVMTESDVRDCIRNPEEMLASRTDVLISNFARIIPRLV